MNAPKNKNLIRIGTYRIGWRNVDVFGDPAKYGGSFWFFPEEDKRGAEMIVGFADDLWWETLNVLLHEAMECSLADLNARYKKTSLFQPNASDAHVFMFNHGEFTEACAFTAHFLAQCERDVERAWKKHKRN